MQSSRDGLSRQVRRRSCGDVKAWWLEGASSVHAVRGRGGRDYGGRRQLGDVDLFQECACGGNVCQDSYEHPIHMITLFTTK